MLRVPIAKVEPGMILARPIPLPNEPRRFLIQRDRPIPRDLIPRLRQLGVQEVWVRHGELEFLEEIFNEELDDHQRDVYAHVRQNFEQVMCGAALELDIRNFTRSISTLFEFLQGSSCGNLLLTKLDAYDNYLLSHSTNVCYLSLLLGLKLESYLIQERHLKTARQAKDVQELGLGCLLHDVGKMRIPLEILNKPAKLTAEEMAVMCTHPTLGYEMVKGRVPTAAAQVVLNHHQRWDGTGYPDRFDPQTGEKLPPLASRQIPVFSRIATVVDVYDAATAQRVYSAAKPSVRVLHEMRTWCRGFFDPVIEQAFREIIPPFPIGKVVTLSNGIEAAVVDFDPQRPYHPKVRGLRDPHGDVFDDPGLEEIDLALYPEITITHVDGHDVRPYLAADSDQLTPAMA